MQIQLNISSRFKGVTYNRKTREGECLSHKHTDNNWKSNTFVCFAQNFDVGETFNGGLGTVQTLQSRIKGLLNVLFRTFLYFCVWRVFVSVCFKLGLAADLCLLTFSYGDVGPLLWWRFNGRGTSAVTPLIVLLPWLRNSKGHLLMQFSEVFDL